MEVEKMNAIELSGSDLLISINELSADLFTDESLEQSSKKYIAEVEFSIDLPLVEMMHFSEFLESVVWHEDCDSKEFKISVHDLSSDKNNLFQLKGSGLAWGIPVTVLDNSFIFELKLWCQLDGVDIMNISRLQKQTWVDIDNSLSADEVNSVWEKKWCLSIEEC